MDNEPIIAAGTKIHSLRDGKYLVTFVKDLHRGDSIMDEWVSDWAIPKPNRGGPIPRDLMEAIEALAFAYVVRTGKPLVRMDYPESDYGASLFEKWKTTLGGFSSASR